MNNFANIITSQHNGMKLAYVQNNEVNYPALFDRLLADEMKYQPLGNANPQKFTYLVDDHKTKYIFKIDGYIEYRPERQLIARITGDFYFNLIHKLARIALDKCDITYELYLVAFDPKTKRHYMIFNFIEGQQLTPDDMHHYGEQIKKCIETLHSYDLVSHDIHGGNFLLTPDGQIKVIDLSNSGFIWLTKANDAVQLWDRFHIKISVSKWAMVCKKLERSLQHLSRQLRGKKTE